MVKILSVQFYLTRNVLAIRSGVQKITEDGNIIETALLINQGSDEPDQGLIEEGGDGGCVVGPRGLDEGGGHSFPRAHVIRERSYPLDRARLDLTPAAGLGGTNQ